MCYFIVFHSIFCRVVCVNLMYKIQIIYFYMRENISSANYNNVYLYCNSCFFYSQQLFKQGFEQSVSLVIQGVCQLLVGQQSIKLCAQVIFSCRSELCVHLFRTIITSVFYPVQCQIILFVPNSNIQQQIDISSPSPQRNLSDIADKVLCCFHQFAVFIKMILYHMT